MVRRGAAIAIVLASSVAIAGCAAIVGLQDHELGSIAIDASATDGADADPCSACAVGYACVDGRCGNEVVEVAASGTHACALLRVGEVWCWGKSQLGALGVDSAATPARCGAYACRPTPARVAGVSSAAHVAVTEDATCALGRDGVVSCWGRSVHGELGHDPAADPPCARQAIGDAGTATESCRATPTAVTMPGNVVILQIVAGSSGACARSVDGHVYCWGDDYVAVDGVFPIPTGGFVATPTRIVGIEGDGALVAMSGADGHGCALRVFDSVWCWGANGSGELGHAKSTMGDKACIFGVACNPIAQAAMGAGGTAIAVGQGASCVRRGDGTVACWGANDSAQLGNGASVDSNAHAIGAVVGLSNIITIEQHYQTGFAIDGNARVWAWGLSSNGALGTPATSIACANGTCVPTATVVPALEGSVQIASTRAGGIALKKDGSVWTWGINELGQLGHAPGDGDASCRDGPCRESPSVMRGLP